MSPLAVEKCDERFYVQYIYARTNQLGGKSVVGSVMYKELLL